MPNELLGSYAEFTQVQFYHRKSVLFHVENAPLSICNNNMNILPGTKMLNELVPYIPTTLSPFLIPRFFNAEANKVTFFFS